MRTRNLLPAVGGTSAAVAPIYKIEDEDDLSKHRTCWLHFVMHSRNQKRRLKKKEIDKIRRAAPCFFQISPHAKRSERRTRSKYSVSKLRTKLDSETFTRYLEDIWKSFSDDRKTSFTYLDCLWFCFYRNADFRNKVMKWIARKHIFRKKYVFVPIVCWGHWYLLILCNFGESLTSGSESPCMLLLDSLKMANAVQLEPDIRKFVKDVYAVEGRTCDLDLVYEVPFLIPKVPQQRNDEECGSYVLYYIYLFMRDAPDDFSMEGYPYFMDKEWFTYDDLEEFRRRLDSLTCKSS